MQWFDNIINTLERWINKVFGYFDFYNANYSKYIVYGGLIYLLSNMLKVKVNLDTRKGKK